MRVTIQDIARETGLAPSTIANVLRDQKSYRASVKTRELVRETARRLGYQPNYFAQRLGLRRSYLLGVVGPLFVYQITNLQLRSIPEVCKQHGYDVLFGDTHRDPDTEKTVIEELRRKHVEGLIVVTQSRAEKVVEALPSDIPSVVIAHEVIPGVPCAFVDRATATQNAVRRLMELGHRRIAFLANTALIYNEAKLAGFRRQMTESGLLDERLIWEAPNSPGAVSGMIQERREMAREVDAFVCSNDEAAAEAISGLVRIGRRVPQDVSVVGFDDTNVAAVVSPAITTLHQPREILGTTAVDMLLEQIAGREVENVTFVPELIERESTGPCPVAR